MYTMGEVKEICDRWSYRRQYAAEGELIANAKSIANLMKSLKQDMDTVMQELGLSLEDKNKYIKAMQDLDLVKNN